VLSKPDTSRRSRAIFISYSSKDQEIAQTICAALETEGLSCWIAPRDVRGGRPYGGQIIQAIRETRILLVILSASSNESPHVMREVERAVHSRKAVLTFRIEPVAPTDDLVYFLGTDHWLDGFAPLPLTRHFPVLIRHVRELLESNINAGTGDGRSDSNPYYTGGDKSSWDWKTPWLDAWEWWTENLNRPESKKIKATTYQQHLVNAAMTFVGLIFLWVLVSFGPLMWSKLEGPVRALFESRPAATASPKLLTPDKN
jgi:hypothetical protein